MFDSAVIVVAESEDRVRSHLARQLDADEATVYMATDLAQAKAKVIAHQPVGLVIGELEEPAEPVALLRAIRGSSGRRGDPPADLPIVMLIDEADELGALRAFDADADDVIARSSAYPLVRARLRLLLGLSGRSRVQATCRVGELELDDAAREVRLDGAPVKLSAKEFALLATLIAEPTRVFTRQELMRDVWGFQSPVASRTLDSHCARLRKKLSGGDRRYIVNVWGVGYALISARPHERRLAA